MKGVSCVVRSVGSTRPREEDHPARRVAGLRVTGSQRSPLPGYSPGTVLWGVRRVLYQHIDRRLAVTPDLRSSARIWGRSSFVGFRFVARGRGIRAGLAVAERRRI